jgi:NADH:ubiquinone oxidoreductase subunit 3 (subunit A)
MTEQWAPTVLFLLLCFAAPVGMLTAAALLRVKAKRNSAAKYDTYECGEEPDGNAWIQFHPRYYVVALIFVLFDVEAVFMFPWAVQLREFGVMGLVDMGIFLAILLLGWFYAIRKGAIKWQ